VLAGLGVSQAARFAVTPYLASGTLVELLPEWSHPVIPIYVVYPPNRHLSARVRAFVEWTAELFATTLAETPAAPLLRKAA
jgi:LysR family transcriptional regulator, regulator for bpeEF and oprC